MVQIPSHKTRLCWGNRLTHFHCRHRSIRKPVVDVPLLRVKTWDENVTLRQGEHPPVDKKQWLNNNPDFGRLLRLRTIVNVDTTDQSGLYRSYNMLLAECACCTSDKHSMLWFILLKHDILQNPNHEFWEERGKGANEHKHAIIVSSSRHSSYLAFPLSAAP